MSSQNRQYSLRRQGQLKLGLLRLSLVSPLLVIASQLGAAEVYSVQVDRDEQKLIVTGTDFNNSTSVSLGGIEVLKANVSADQFDIPFATAVYSAIQWEGSYNLILDDTVRISVYIDAPIVAPPPPPPPGGPDCPCITGWQAANVYPDTYLCGDGEDGTQSYIYGSSFVDGSFLSAAFDPNNIYYDPLNPSNSISYCVLLDSSNNFLVSEPVVNEDQYLDCYSWMWTNACL